MMLPITKQVLIIKLIGLYSRSFAVENAFSKVPLRLFHLEGKLPEMKGIYGALK